MPNTASAAKQARSSARRHKRNQSNRSQLRSIKKRFLSALEDGKKDEAKAMLPKVISSLDKAVKRGLIHANVASRTKSRLGARLKKAA